MSKWNNVANKIWVLVLTLSIATAFTSGVVSLVKQYSIGNTFGVHMVLIMLLMYTSFISMWYGGRMNRRWKNVLTVIAMGAALGVIYPVLCVGTEYLTERQWGKMIVIYAWYIGFAVFIDLWIEKRLGLRKSKRNTAPPKITRIRFTRTARAIFDFDLHPGHDSVVFERKGKDVHHGLEQLSVNMFDLGSKTKEEVMDQLEACAERSWKKGDPKKMVVTWVVLVGRRNNGRQLVGAVVTKHDLGCVIRFPDDEPVKVVGGKVERPESI